MSNRDDIEDDNKSTILEDSDHHEGNDPKRHELEDDTPDDKKGQEKKLTRRQTIEKALKDLEAQDKEGDPKDKRAVKDDANDEGGDDSDDDSDDDADDADDEKKAKKDDDDSEGDDEKPKKDEKREDRFKKKGNGRDDGKGRPSDGRHTEPPAHFLPRAKEKWDNVPNVVKSEIARTFKEHETATAQYKEIARNWDDIREYDEMAKASGTTLKQAMTRYVSMERELNNNPAQGIAAILQTVGLTPEAYAVHILKAAQARAGKPDPHYVPPQVLRGRVGMGQQQPQRQAEIAPEVKAIREEMARMKAETIYENVVVPFKQEHPRYSELEKDIEFFLNSGRIPTSLSYRERLEHAYDMAERLNGRSSDYDDEGDDDEDEDDGKKRRKSAKKSPLDDPAGRKSIKGAPGSGSDLSGRKNKRMSRTDAVRAAMDELGIT